LYAGLTMHPKLREVDFSRLRLSGGGGAAVVGAVSDRWKEITFTRYSLCCAQSAVARCV